MWIKFARSVVQEEQVVRKKEEDVCRLYSYLEEIYFL